MGELVDAIGGVYFDVPRRMYYNDLSQHFKIDLQPGYQLLDATVPWVCSAGGTTAMTAGTFSTAATPWAIWPHRDPAGIPQGGRPQVPPADVLLSNLMDYISIFQKNVTTDLSVGNLAYFASRPSAGWTWTAWSLSPCQPVRWGRPPAARGQPDCGDGQ